MKDDLILEAINGLSRRIEKLDDKIDNVNVSLNEKIDNLDAKMEHKFGMLQAQLEDFKKETRENFRGVGTALNTAMESLDRQIKKVKTENDLEHQEFKKYLKIG